MWVLLRLQKLWFWHHNVLEQEYLVHKNVSATSNKKKVFLRQTCVWKFCLNTLTFGVECCFAWTKLFFKIQNVWNWTLASIQKCPNKFKLNWNIHSCMQWKKILLLRHLNVQTILLSMLLRDKHVLTKVSFTQKCLDNTLLRHQKISKKLVLLLLQKEF